MTDLRMAPASGVGGLMGFLAEARQGLDGRIAVPALLMLATLTASNIVLLRNLPPPGEMLGGIAALATLGRVIGLFILSVPLLRLMSGSQRPAWRPDGAFFLYFAVVLFSLALGAALVLALIDPADPGDPLRQGLKALVTTLIVSPLAPWLVGIAAAVPLGLNPTRFLRRFGDWFPHLLFWMLVLVTPLAAVHAVLDMGLLRGEVEWFWPAALLDGLLSLVILLLTYALHAAAYRRVARG